MKGFAFLVAVQCVCEAYGLDLANKEQERTYAITPNLEVSAL